MDFRTVWGSKRACGVVLAAALCVFSNGCLGQISKHATALSEATAPVVDQAEAAYQAANIIHEKRTDFDAIAAFDKTEPVYNPRTALPLLTGADIDARLTVLKAFQSYVQLLVQITNGTDSPALDADSASLGGSLAGLGNTIAPAPKETITDLTPASTISKQTQNLMSAGADALGQFLVYRVVKKDLPAKVIELDPKVQKLCELMASDVDALHDAEEKDFDSVIDHETLYLRDPNVKMSTEERREAIMKLPELGREQDEADAQLTQLKHAIVKLELTHHALAAEAQGNNPESLKSKLGDLVSAGKNLGKFYSSSSAH